VQIHPKLATNVLRRDRQREQGSEVDLRNSPITGTRVSCGSTFFTALVDLMASSLSILTFLFLLAAPSLL